MAKKIIRRVIPVYRGDWSPIGAARDLVKVDDIVDFSGSSWICRREHTADNDPLFGTQPSGIYSHLLWLEISGGLEVPAPSDKSWDSSKVYHAGEIIIYGAASWIATARSVGLQPNDHPDFWMSASKAAIFWEDVFDNTKSYIAGALVQYQNSVYYALNNTSGFQPILGKGLTDFEAVVTGAHLVRWSECVVNLHLASLVVDCL
jgi:hypothetical protein